MKVVRRLSNGTLVSCLAAGKARVVYKPGEWTEAPEWLSKEGYNLTSFISFETAWRFAKDYPNKHFEIWEAEAEDITTALPPKLKLTWLEFGEMLESSSAWWPDGTVMCRRLKLVRRVMRI